MSGAVQILTQPKDAPRSRDGLWATLRRLPVIPTTIIVVFVLISLFGEWLTPATAYEQNLRLRFLPPSWLEGGDARFLLGTDNLGRDITPR